MPDVDLIGKMIALGVTAGLLSGMFGIGGGLVIVPILIMVFHFESKTAIGTSLLALLAPTGLLGALEYYRRGEIRIIPGALIALGLFCGAYFGARLTGIISTSTMKRGYAVFLIIVAIYFLWTSSPTKDQPGAALAEAPSPSPPTETSQASSTPVH